MTHTIKELRVLKWAGMLGFCVGWFLIRESTQLILKSGLKSHDTVYLMVAVRSLILTALVLLHLHLSNIAISYAKGGK